MTDTRELRPEHLGDFAGQPEVTKHLDVILSAAKSRGEMPDHVLLSGPPGLGKTSLALIIGREMGLPVLTTSGPALEKPGDLAGLLSGLGTPHVVFIDEIHRLTRPVEETLYPAMEDGVIDVILGEGAKARSIQLPLQPFVLVGATTQAGMLSGPLRDRFGHTANLRLYSEESLAGIVARSARLLRFPVDDNAALTIASRSRGTPRIANKMLRRVRDWVADKGIEVVSGEQAAEALTFFGIDEIGLDVQARAILHALCVTYAGRPVGVGTLAKSIGEAPNTLEEVYEPFLLNRGLLAITPRGRAATGGAYAHLGLDMPAAALLAVEPIPAPQLPLN